MALKGVALSCKTDLAVQQLEWLEPDWFYTWGSKPNLADPLNFTPMVWGQSSVANIPQILADLPATKAKNLLGFNEPDLDGQADMTVARALELWPELQKATGLRLGSPATIKPNATWMDDFMTEAIRRGYRIDFVTMHCYGWANVDDFLRKVRELYERWGKPIWVTEYAVADFSAKTLSANRYPRSQVNDFMAGTIEGMHALPYVERFSWKTRAAGDPQMGTSTLFHSDGSLTSTGRLYASL